ncbi:MAG TPA: hypothetical protein VMW93_04550 [bacterium]|nr:hypothetical protein [bacterium]
MRAAPAILCAVLALAAAGHAVVAVGRVPATGDAEADREAALAQARRRAVEEAVGVIVDATVRLENQLLIEDEVYTKSKGLVTNELITGEREVDGFYEVTLSCDVEDLGLAAELDRLKNAILVTVTVKDALPAENRLVEGIIRERLVAAGYNCLDAAYLRGKDDPGEVSNPETMPPEDLQTLGRRYLAQVILYGEVSTADAGVVGDELPYVGENPFAGLRIAHAAGNAKAVDTSSGQILAERQARPGEFRGFGEDEEAADADALVRLASSYAAYFDEALAALK